MGKQVGDSRSGPPSANDATGTEEQRHAGYHKRIMFVGGCFAALAAIPGLVTSAVVASQIGTYRQIRAMILGSLIFAAAGFALGVAIMCLMAPQAFLTGPVGRRWMKLIGTKRVLVARIACLLLGLLVAVILVLVWIGFINKMSATTAPGSTTWEPDPSLLDQLAPAAPVEDYEVRPPKGYVLNRPPGPHGGRFFFWIGPARSNQTAPKLGIILTTLPPAEAKETTLEKFLADHLLILKERHTGWSQGATEWGQINGLSFLRVRYEGQFPDSGQKMHGFLYMAQDGPNFIEVISRDVEPYHIAALKLADTAARTFRKR